MRRTALRDFSPPAQARGQRDVRPYKLTLSPDDAPLPALLKYALNLIGLQAYGPAEKVAWWLDFTYRGESCQLAYEKFGLRLYVWTNAPDEQARRIQAQIVKQLKSSIRTVESLILDSAPNLLGEGAATVVNQHKQLQRAYDYFRSRALDPHVIEDETVIREPNDGIIKQSITFKSGAIQMEMNAFHDMVAAITAYLSLLEHDLVLALAFNGFDPAAESLTSVISMRWGEKFDRLLGHDVEARRFKQRLTNIVERWRNPYSHGGFEKGHAATIFLHAPGVGAIPVGLTKVRSSPLFSLIPATETDITEVFDLFDDLDSRLKNLLPEALRWINSGLDVRFDEEFRSLLAVARVEGDFDGLLDYFKYQQSMTDNMDY